MSGGATQPFVRSYRIPRAKLGLNAVTLAAQRTSNTFNVGAYNQLQADFVCVHGAGATTALTFYFENTRDKGTTWHRLQTSSIVAGTETISDHLCSKAFTGAMNFSYLLGLPNYEDMRLILESQEAADIITVDITLGVV